jgi:ParB family chromosome partitioning protein
VSRTIKVHDIAKMWPQMSDEEFNDLVSDIAAHGLLEAISTWHGAVVDGKHRLRACQKAGVDPRFDKLDDDWDEPRVIQHCASKHTRRNLTPSQRAAVGALIKQRFEAAARERQRGAGARGVEGGRGKKKPLASAEAKGSGAGKAAAAAAKAAGASRANVERAARVQRDAPEAFEKVRDGKMSVQQAERVAKAPPEQRATMMGQLATQTRSQEAGDSWGTPPEWIDLARRVMGGIDVDPASNAHAQKTVKAGRYFTTKDDGLAKKWKGRVWLNPPYSQPGVTLFAQKLLAELERGNVKQACVLVNNATDTQWAQGLLAACSAALFPEGRVQFIAPGGTAPITGTRQGQMLLYFGGRTKTFVAAARALGWVGVSPP